HPHTPTPPTTTHTTTPTTPTTPSPTFSFFFFNDTAPTEIYTLSLHDALPIYAGGGGRAVPAGGAPALRDHQHRSEEHTSELQSHLNLVCRLLLEIQNHLMHRRRSDHPGALLFCGPFFLDSQ